MERINGDKGIMPLKQGYADVWAMEPDVAIRLFRYLQAPHFMLSYLMKKTKHFLCSVTIQHF
ncbi:hypothetical protein [Virgibacillus pantothenticus]|uniref:hypothetical protein n=1 Tax=Virgibacillus pantothenticus TaxID=1473 RepID=UPI001BB0BB2C|nr:hypothetical protein [Virgibacillus pantothenticus]